MDVLTVYPCLETDVSNFARENTVIQNHLFIKVFRDGVDDVGSIPPHLLATLTYLATRINSERVGYLSSRTIARELNITRETAMTRVKELALIQVSNQPVITFNKHQSSRYSPTYYTYTLGAALPFLWDCSHTSRQFVKLYTTQARELLSRIEPELWAVLLVLGLQMDSERICNVTLVKLSAQLGVAVSTISERLKRLIDGGWIDRLPTKANQQSKYLISPSVPLAYGAEDTWVEELLQSDSLLSESSISVSGSLDTINKSERIKEDNTIQNDKLANIDTRHDVVEYDKQEIKDLQKLCGVSNVAIWLDRVGLGRLLQVFEESKKAQHSRGGWIRKAVEWTAPCVRSTT